MKEIEEDFLRDCLKAQTSVDVSVDINERIMAYINDKVSRRLTNERVLIWGCVASVVVALGCLLGYLYYVGSLQFKVIELGATDKLWLVIGCFITLFMVLSLYLSRRLERSGR